MAVVHLERHRNEAAALSGIKLGVMTITPQLAEEWLAKNKANRHTSQRTIDAYARDMKNGAFVLSNDAVAFDEKGNLLNSQHRLLACIEAQTSFQAIVVEGLPTDSRNIMDSGMKRKLSDVLHFSGHVSVAALSGALSWLNRIKLASEGRSISQRMTTAEGLGMLERHAKMEQSVSYVGCHGISQRGSVFGPPPTLAIAMHYVCANLLKERELAGRFIDVFRFGEPAYKGDPSILWRERLIRNREKALSFSRDEQLRGLAHCWNLFAKRRKIEQFKVPDDFRIDGLDQRKI
jgi:hypothetical protein